MADSITPQPDVHIPRKPILKKIILIVLLVILIGASYLILKNPNVLQKKIADIQKSSKVIAKVGVENIYEEDLKTDLFYPFYQNNPEATESSTQYARSLNHLIDDSIALQAGASEGWIKLDDTVFNSPSKTYPKRVEMVNMLKDRFKNSDKYYIEGSYVSIFFHNAPFVPKIGLEKAKQTASQKITALYNDVKAGKITIKQAGEQLKADSSLKEIDPSYQSNAYTEFTKVKGESASAFEGFNDLLWKAKSGELTPIYLGQDKDSQTGNRYDAIYLFGQVNNNHNPDISGSYATWLESQRSKYKVEYL